VTDFVAIYKGQFAILLNGIASLIPTALHRTNEKSPAQFSWRTRMFFSMHHLLRLTSAWILVALYAGGIFAASSLSHPPLVSTWDLPYIDKLYHMIAYGGLTFVLIRALCLTCTTRPSTSVVLWAAFLAVIYGASDELHQVFTPGRAMSLYDLLADAMGAGIVAGVWLWVQHRWPTLVKSKD
jgi:VanZ like family